MMPLNYLSILLLFTGLGSVTTFPSCPLRMNVKETDDSCVAFITGMTFFRDSAIESCKEELGDKATLATIKDAAESKIIGSITAGSSWLGLQRSTKDNQWYWDDGIPFNFTKWAMGEPITTEAYRCAYFGEAELWMSTTCDKKYKAVCKAPKDSQWKIYNDYEFYAVLYVHNGVTWYKARESCMSMGGDLMTITTHGQYSQINKWLEESGSSTDNKVWTGLNAIDYTSAETQWRWSDGTHASLFYWNESFPISTVEGAGCVYTVGHSSPHGRWMNTNCGIRQSGYICKRPKGYDGGPITDTPPIPPTGNCPPGYFSVGEKCAKVFPTGVKTWHEALEACRKEPGKNPDLVSITSKYVSVVIMSSLPLDASDLWIGGYNLDEDGWGWSDQVPFGDFTNFELESGPSCLSVGKPGVSLGRWSPDECQQKKAFICQTHKDPEFPPRPLECSEGFIARNNYCYKVNKDKLSWTAANKACVGWLAKLVTIDTERDNQFVFSKVLEGGDDTRLWIGLHDLSNTEEYEWIDNSKLNYTAWGRGQPRRAVEGGCVAMRESFGMGGLGIWEDKNCSATYISMCRRPREGLMAGNEIPAVTQASGATSPIPSFTYLILLVILLHLNRGHLLANN